MENESADTKAGRMLYLTEEVALAAVRDADRAAQADLRAELVDVLKRHDRPLEQTVAVLGSILAEARAAYDKTLMGPEG